MDGKKNDMYSRAAKIKSNGWVPADMDFIVVSSADETPALPQIIEPPMTHAISIQPMPEAMQMPAAKPERECGYCITLAMSYTPMQKWGHTYEPELGLERGTIFPELDLPFVGEGACLDE